jgi:hypothetical protein
MTPRQTDALTADAKNRALRTFLQNLGVDVVVAALAVLIPVFTDANAFGELEWKIIAFSVGKTIVLTAFAFIMRRFLDKSAFPTPLPPAPVAVPNEDIV